jgi:hypothetical protein
MKNNLTNDENPINNQAGCYTTESLSKRLNVSKKFIVAHRANLPGAMKIGRIWRFDKVAVEKKLLSGRLL